jgi:hypothetical protein
MENILQDGRRKRPKFESSVSRAVLFSLTMLLIIFSSLPSSGTPIICSSSGSSHYLDFLHLSTTSLRWPRRRRLPIRTSDAPPIQPLSTTATIASELWSQRTHLWGESFSERHLCHPNGS